MRCERRQLHCLHGEVFVIDADWVAALASIGFTRDTDWATFAGDVLISKSLEVTRCYRSDLDDGRSVYVKRYVYPYARWREFWLRPAKSAIECWAYSRLQALGIPTLKVVAFAERRRLAALGGGCIVTEGIPDTIDLETFARTVWCRWPRSERRDSARRIAERLLRQARTAHEGGFFHHDLKWRNLLIATDGDPDSLVWIDAPRASRMRLRQRRGVITDLSGLARVALSLFSRTERMRFLRSYLGASAGREERKRLFRAVQRHLSRRMPVPLELDYVD
ncbi:MAG: hypothetical protein KDJ24_13880 [Gammaproteobacteria bacterium]|nr:hypothetical protein [Gammaproteobacteria bacterium]